jgi:stage II sporulation protein D
VKRWWCVSILFLLACAQAPAPTTGYARPMSSGNEVRVGLVVSAESLRFEPTRMARWDTVGASGVLEARPVEIVLREGRMVLRQSGLERPLGPDPVRFDRAEWFLGGDRFAGSLVALRAAGGGLTLVNVVDLEEYLRGVVPWEIGRPDESGLEAVKAQAIAARTYPVGHLGQWTELGFDVYADVRDQVYRGRTGRSAITDRAVRETAERILVFEGEPARAYYSSTCGGHTSTLTDVWDREGAPYLVGRRDADPRGRSWCIDSPHFRWTESWSARELGEGFRRDLGNELERPVSAEDFGILQGLQVVSRDRSGRVHELRIVTDRDSFTVVGDRIRWVLRPAHSRFAILRSTLFEIEEVRRAGTLVQVILRGGGFGHGVGLCQTGALGQARAGRSAGEILESYYPGARVEPQRRILRPAR